MNHRLISLLAFIAIWTLLATYLNNVALPTPMAVFEALLSEIKNGELFYHLAMTLFRVIAAFFIAMLVGSILGIAMGIRPTFNRFGDDWLTILLNIPALVTIILAYIWFGLNDAAAIGAVALNKIPNVIVTIREGTKALAPQYFDIAKVYRFSNRKTLRHIILPQLTPYFMAAARSGIALIWKIVLVVELLGRSNGVGFQLHLYFQMFQIDYILAYTVAFIIIMLTVEGFVISPLEKRVNRWKVQDA